MNFCHVFKIKLQHLLGSSFYLIPSPSGYDNFRNIACTTETGVQDYTCEKQAKPMRFPNAGAFFQLVYK